MDRSDEYQGAGRSTASVSGWLVVILLVVVAILLFRNVDFRRGALHDPDAKPRVVDARGDLSDLENATIELFRSASPSVVHIVSAMIDRSGFNLNPVEIPRGSGSGFVWNGDGHIVTNYHVISGAEVANVTLADGTTWPARLVGREPSNDLAVLKIDAPANQLVPIPIGESGDLQVGQTVFAIGNPFSLDQTLTTGVISGLGREIPSGGRAPISDVIQTDAAINPGNSGGPLLDSAGRLIGVNTAIFSPSGAYAGVGFAIPVDTVNRVIPELIAGRTIEQAGLGIAIFPENLLERFRRAGLIEESGVVIRQVTEGSAAERAGLRGTKLLDDGTVEWGDIIVGIGDVVIEDSEDLLSDLSKRRVGETITVSYIREGGPRETEVTLQALNRLAP